MQGQAGGNDDGVVRFQQTVQQGCFYTVFDLFVHACPGFAGQRDHAADEFQFPDAFLYRAYCDDRRSNPMVCYFSMRMRLRVEKTGCTGLGEVGSYNLAKGW